MWLLTFDGLDLKWLFMYWVTVSLHFNHSTRKESLDRRNNNVAKGNHEEYLDNILIQPFKLI